MKIGRNAPCPCGSGKKHKSCCLNAAERSGAESPELLVWRRVRRVLDGFPARMLKFVSEIYGPEALLEAWEEFHLWTDGEPPPFDPDSPFTPLFFSWFFHAWQPDIDTAIEDQSLHGCSPTAEFLRRRGAHLEPVLRRYLEACVEAPFSFHEILHAERGVRFRARDVLSGEERQVLERSASEHMQRGDLLFGQLVEVDGIVMLEAASPVLLPPGSKIEVMELRGLVMDERYAASPRARLREFDAEIREVYLLLAHRLLYPAPPELRNTDGDVLAPHRVVFDIDSPHAAFHALKHLSVAESEEQLLASAKRSADGRIERVSIRWSTTGNALHSSWESTILGSIHIRRGRLTGEVNSAERAARLRRIVEEALGGQARHRATRRDNLERALRDARSGRDGPALGPAVGSEDLAELPEVKAEIARLMAAHYEEWVTTKIPALGGRTPLEAVADPDGREKVEALVVDLERGSGAMALEPEILQRLRERLGLARSGDGAT